jgi:hypothetical protein
MRGNAPVRFGRRRLETGSPEEYRAGLLPHRRGHWFEPSSAHYYLQEVLIKYEKGDTRVSLLVLDENLLRMIMGATGIEPVASSV